MYEQNLDDPLEFRWRNVATAAGWGGLPRIAAYYELETVDKSDGKTPYAVTVKDVPVDAFWSITVYNADGYLEANDLGVNSLKHSCAIPNEDGSYTIHFGGCDDGRANCVPITSGWNYTVRIYQTREAILDGSWTFPDLVPVR
jgi:hypothetical protein